MFVDLNREEFIALLDKLGSADDDEVLGAARDLHAKVTVAGVTWDELLAPEPPADGDDDGLAAVGDTAGDGETVLVAPEPDHSPLTDAETAEAKSLIDAIGAMEISDITRSDLRDYAAELAAGHFEQMDLRYLRALNKRLKG